MTSSSDHRRAFPSVSESGDNMEGAHDATLILLTLDELPGLRAIFDRVPRHLLRDCIAVDGGSTDGTLAFLEARGIPVLSQTRVGWGKAVVLGARRVRTGQMVFFSPDGNQNPEDIPRLLQKLDEGYDMAIASRFARASVHEQDGDLLRLRARGSRLLTRIGNGAFAHGYRLTDATNSFRAITLDAMRKLDSDALGFELAYQMTLRAMREGLRVAEIPTFEAPRMVKRSNLRAMTVGFDHLRSYLHERLR